jgi:spherulation-specific family 4 protein
MSRYGLSIIIFLLVAGGVSSTLLASIKHQSTRKQLGQQAEDLRSGTASAAAASTRPPDEQAAESASAGKVAVIYYGWLIDESGQPNASARRLAAGKPDMIIAAAYTDNPRRSNLPPGVRALFNESHTRIAAYIATDYGRRPLPDVQAEIADVAAKVDGIFLDEVVASFDPQTWAYYAAVAAQVRSAGKTVIVNPGLAAIDERIMDIADIVMLEHQWIQFASNCGWCAAYPPDRFMGVSSNEPRAAQELGHAIDARQAELDTRRAWRLGVGWHYSCDRYTEVPVWYDTYMQAIRGTQ